MLQYVNLNTILKSLREAVTLASGGGGRDDLVSWEYLGNVGKRQKTSERA